MNRVVTSSLRITYLLFAVFVCVSLVMFALQLFNKEDSTNGKAPYFVPTFRAAVAKAAPSVVNIFTTQQGKQQDYFYDTFFGPEQQLGSQNNLGSGVIYHGDGYIMTNHHVIKGADSILVALSNGYKYPAEIVGTDPDTDLALLFIEADNLIAIEKADMTAAAVGDVVLAIGNPFGIGQSISMGIISALGRSSVGISVFESFIQTDAAINPGNSGGALVNYNGELIGVNTAIYSRASGNQGIGFSIPVNLVQQVFDAIILDGKVMRGWLGVLLAKNKANVQISGVTSNGPAERAGLLTGDVVTAIDAQAVKDVGDILNYVSAHDPGEVVTLQIQRSGKTILIAVTLSARPIP